MFPAAMAPDAEGAQIPKLVRSACGQRDHVIYFKRNSGDAACNTAIAVALQHRGARPLPGPAIAATGEVVPLVPAPAAGRRALRTPAVRRELAAVQAAPHSLKPNVGAAPGTAGYDAEWQPGRTHRRRTHC